LSNRFIKKAASRKAELVGTINLNNKIFTVAADGNMALGLVDGYKVIDHNLYDDPIPNIVPVLSSIIAKAFRDMWHDGLTIDIINSDWDSKGKYPSKEFKEAFIKELSDIVGSDSIRILEKSDEVLDEVKNPVMFVNNGKLSVNLQKYSDQVKQILLSFESLMEKTSSIMRIKLVESTWGMNDVMSLLDQVRSNSLKAEEIFKKIGQASQTTDRSSNRILCRINSNNTLTKDDNKFIVAVLIPDILISYESLKNNVCEALKIYGPIYKLDNVFKNLTGNLCSWSIPSNLLIDFKEDFEVLINFIADTPVIELTVMEPLESIQLKLSGLKSSEIVEKGVL
jgi:hypothetical protein